MVYTIHVKDRGEPRDNRSIIERIHSAMRQRSRTLLVTPREFEAEIGRLAKHGDTQSLLQLFNTYFAWEVAVKTRKQSIEDVRNKVLKNFDDVSRVADARTVAKDDITAFSLARAPYPSCWKNSTIL